MSEIRLITLITSLFSGPIPMPILLLLFTLATTSSAHNRRVLHQPFPPQDSPPLSPPPQLPFSTSSPPSPFFQDFPPPPPPSSSSSSSVPANISSLSLPKSPKTKHISPKLIATALVSLLAAAALFIFIILLHICRRKAPNTSPKPQTPDNSGDSNTNVNQSTTLKSSKTSSEFLHLGTLLNSQPTSHINIHDTLSRNLESPELRPLPPLRLSGQQHQHQHHQNADYSSPGTPTIRIFQEPLSFNNEIGESGSTSSSSFSSYLLAESDSGSSLKSASVSISPPPSLSPKRRSMSPESLAFRTIITSLSLESSPRVSNVSSISLSPRLSDVSSHHFCTSPTKISYFVPVAVAPPPAPLLSPTASVSSLSSPEKALSKCEISSQTSLLDQTFGSPAGTSNPLPVAITFKLNEEMNKPRSTINGTTEQAVLASTSPENGVLDPQKSQNIAILLTALHMTIEEVCEALLEGNVDKLGTELLESLSNMAPTEEEELKLKDEDDSRKLDPTENVFKAMLDIPFAFKRVDAMLYISNFCSAVEHLKRSFETLEAACEELRNSRMFLKVLDVVLRIGNQMNDGANHGDAQASKLDAVLKLIVAKGAVGKTTILHYVIHEMIEMEGARLWSANQNFEPAATDDDKYRKLGLQVVSSISSELSNVKKAASMDSRVLNSAVLKLYEGIGIIEEIIEISEAVGPEVNSRGFSESMNKFLKVAKEVITSIQAQENVSLSLVKEITEYFHGNSANEEAHPFRIFMVARDFLMTFDIVCEEVEINEGTIFIPANRLLPQCPLLQFDSLKGATESFQ